MALFGEKKYLILGCNNMVRRIVLPDGIFQILCPCWTTMIMITLMKIMAMMMTTMNMMMMGGANDGCVVQVGGSLPSPAGVQQAGRLVQGLTSWWGSQAGLQQAPPARQPAPCPKPHPLQVT